MRPVGRAGSTRTRPAHPVGRPGGAQGGHQSAERVAHQHHRPVGQPVEDARRGVATWPATSGGAPGGRGAPVAEQVDGDQPVAAGQVRGDGRPVEVAAAQAVDGRPAGGRRPGRRSRRRAPVRRRRARARRAARRAGRSPGEATGNAAGSGRSASAGAPDLHRRSTGRLTTAGSRPGAGSRRRAPRAASSARGPRSARSATVPPRSSDDPVICSLGQGEVAAAPHPEGRGLHRRGTPRSGPPTPSEARWPGTS